MNINKVVDLEKTEPFDAEFNGHLIKGEAYSTGWTPGFMEEANSIALYPLAVVRAVKSWDITIDEEGTPLPITVAALKGYPKEFFEAVLGKIAESYSGDKKKSQASATGSSA